MIADFPLLQQPPGSNSCFSTSVRAVLLWWGEQVSQREAQEWCREGRRGCILDLAIDGLREAGFDVEELTAPTEEEAREILCTTITDEDNPQPVIVTLANPLVSLDGDHAVVVINIRQAEAGSGTREIIEYMDPLTGNIEQDISGLFWQFWLLGQLRAVVIRP
jgi:hypothetical protein